MKRMAMMICVVCISMQAVSNTWYVDVSRPDDTGDGASWATAKKTIQGAVDLTASNDIVLVTNGVYDAGGMVTPGFSLTNRVCITNAIFVQSVNGPSNTVIVGEGPLGSSAMRCVYMVDGAVLDGFTISGGNTFAPSYSPRDVNDLDAGGGGALLYYGGMITNCIVTGCKAKWCGGGVHAYHGGEIIDCELKNNTVYYQGAAIRLERGGLVDRCHAHDNLADDWDGGGVFVYYEGVVRNSLFDHNEAYSGAGVYLCNYSGAGPQLVNCTVADNSAFDDGGGLRCLNGGVIRNCIIYHNSVSFDGPNYYNTGPDISCQYTCITPAIAGTGNITNAPVFTDRVAGDYHLRSLGGRWNGTDWVVDASIYSPCIDAADPATDYTLEPAPNGGRANLGCYGNTAEASKSGFEIDVLGNGVPIVSGDSTPDSSDQTLFGGVGADGGSVIHTFNIANLGTLDLTLGGISLDNSNHFAVVVNPSSPVAGGSSTSFQIAFCPVSAGVHSTTVSIANGDADENPYTFTVEGTGVSSGAVWSVAPDGNDFADGNGWSTPFASILHAIDAASEGDTVLIEYGTYEITGSLVLSGKNICLSSDDGTGTGWEDAAYDRDLAIINAGGNCRCLTITGSDVTTNTVIRGFTFTGGDATSEASGAGMGGGLYLAGGADATIEQVAVSDCVASVGGEGRGGGICFTGIGTGGTIRDSSVNACIAVSGGTGSAYGGGVYVGLKATLSLFDSIISNNTGVVDNSSIAYGGGIALHEGNNAQVVISDCIIADNLGSAQNRGDGGGVHAIGYSLQISGCDVRDNFTSGTGNAFGGGLNFRYCDDVVIEHCLIRGNRADVGGGIRLDNTSGTVRYNTFYANTGDTEGSGINRHNESPSIMYNIFAGNQDSAAVYSGEDGFIIDYNGFYDNGGGNFVRTTDAHAINADPLFADAVSGDFHLQSRLGRWNGSDWVTTDTVSSPLLDGAAPVADYSAEPAPNGLRANLGRYGNTAEASMSRRSLDILGNANVISDGDETPEAGDGTLFDSEFIDGSDGMRSYSITNTGTVVLEFTSISADSGVFTVSGISLPFSLPEFGSADFTLTYDPESAGTDAATVTVSSNAEGDLADYTFAIQGEGVALVAPAQLPPAINIDVTQGPGGHEDITLSAGCIIRDLDLKENGSNGGDYGVQVGIDFSDDVTNGVLIACVREDARDYSGVDHYATAAIASSDTGSYFIPVSDSPDGSELNMNVAAAYFPFDENWVCGYLTNSVNNGEMTGLIGSPGLTLGDEVLDDPGTTGEYLLTIPGVDSLSDGILLVCGGRNEDNFALSKANTNGSWTIYCHDNGQNYGTDENDGVAFAYVPLGLTDMVAGKFDTEADILLGSGFNVVHTNTGTFRLTAPGYSTERAILLVSPEGGEGYNADNIVTYEVDGDGWLIHTRDIAGMGLQDLSANEPVASFALLLAEPDIDVRGNGVSIVSGDTTPVFVDSTDFGNVPFGGGAITGIFSIVNSGPGSLNLTGTPVVVLNNETHFSVVAQPTDDMLLSGESATFQVAFNPASTGLHTATVSIASDDPDENHYTFAIRGSMPVITGVSGDALDLDGGGYVNCGNDDSLSLAGSYTITAWIKPRAFNYLGGIAGKYHTSGSRGFVLRLSNTSPYTGINFDEMQTASGVLASNTWCHIAAVNDGGTRHLYVNGVEVGLTGTPLSVVANNDPLCIGVDYLQSPRYFNGTIDEVAIYNEALSIGQIREQMHLTAAGGEEGLVSCWQFNEGSGTTALDATGRGNGTLAGDATRIDSTAPVAAGASATALVAGGQTGSVDFSGTEMSMDFSAKSGETTFVVSHLDASPNMRPAGETISDEYWIVHAYGTGGDTWTADLSFLGQTGFGVNDAAHPDRIQLYGRSANSESADWSQRSVAGSVSIGESATFNDQVEFSQLVLARGPLAAPPPRNRYG